MIEGIYNSQNEYSVQEANGTDVFSKKQSEINGNETNPAVDKNSNGYELSFTDKGWNVLNDSTGKEELSEEDQRKVDELEKIDRKVRTHEQAHLSAAGGYARGGANYSFVTGPDGKRYANAGHVNIDTSPENTPEATIRKAETVRKAALAPADPSPSDKQIAADAAKMAQNAQRELAMKQEDDKN
ncbi:MAG: hypothetical protein LBQ76_07970 [Candidatus Fibromonas sp.]|nr:hypothetical protein [Candidatus Fibromonas sp.]